MASRARGVHADAKLNRRPEATVQSLERNHGEVLGDLVSALQFAVGQDNVIVDAEERARYGRDDWSYHSGPPPDVVVTPRTTEAVAAAVKVCAARRVPIVPRGAGTSLEGHTTTPHRGVVIDLTHMDRTIAVRPDDLDCTVEAGVRWQELNAHLAQHGLFFPMDPGPGASIGGMCGTGCSGTNAVRYGTMKANVISLTVVLPDGSVMKTASRARKSSAGYDLTSLIIGSEGTLGIVTEATLKLQAVPAETAVAVCAFPSIRAASDAVRDTMRTGVGCGAIELLDAPMIHAVNVQSGFDYPARPHVFFKFAGSSGKVADDASTVEAIVSRHGGSAFQWTRDAAGKERLWEARKVALWSAGAMDHGRKIATTDVCVPISRMPDLMATFEETAASSPLKVYAVGHVGDGNAHHFIAFNPDDPEEVAEARRLNSTLVHTAIGMGGTCTGEHGTGVGKLPYLAEELGEGNLAVMRAVKAALDPLGIMNPGKKVPPLGPHGHAGAGHQQAGTGHDKAAGHGLLTMELAGACDCVAGYKRPSAPAAGVR